MTVAARARRSSARVLGDGSGGGIAEPLGACVLVMPDCMLVRVETRCDTAAPAQPGRIAGLPTPKHKLMTQQQKMLGSID